MKSLQIKNTLYKNKDKVPTSSKSLKIVKNEDVTLLEGSHDTKSFNANFSLSK